MSCSWYSMDDAASYRALLGILASFEKWLFVVILLSCFFDKWKEQCTFKNLRETDLHKLYSYWKILGEHPQYWDEEGLRVFTKLMQKHDLCLVLTQCSSKKSVGLHTAKLRHCSRLFVLPSSLSYCQGFIVFLWLRSFWSLLLDWLQISVFTPFLLPHPPFCLSHHSPDVV